MARRAFFFPHPPGEGRPTAFKEGQTPGRVPFAVTSTLASLTAPPRDATAWIFADGYWPRDGAPSIGSNQDPCVFASPLACFHAFARIDHPNKQNQVVFTVDGTEPSLPELVSAGDLIFYGKANLADGFGQVWCDTVLVVDRVEAVSKLLAAHGPADPAYQYALVDAEPSGLHAKAARKAKAIVGRATATSEALASAATSFVPLADKNPDGRWDRCTLTERDLGPELWTPLRRFLKTRVFAGEERESRAGRIAEFTEPDVATGLYAALARLSGRRQDKAGFVAIPPLVPTTTPKRLDPRDGRVLTHAEYLREYGREGGE